MNNKHRNSFYGSLFFGAIFLSCPLFAKEDNQADPKTVSRSENVPGAFDDNLSLNALAKKITDNKLQENSDIITRLAGKKSQTKSQAGVIKKKIALAEQQGKGIKAQYDNYGKASKIVGGVGKALSIYDAYQNSFVKGKDGKKEFSKTAFVKNAAMNLSGIAGLSSAYKAGMETKEREFLKCLDEYEKAGKDITDPEIIYKAMVRATGKALIVGAYEGAKCIPLAGDAINVYELTESSIGLVHDTLESQRIRQENKEEQGRQAQASSSGLKAYVQKAKLCRDLFEQQNKQAIDAERQLKKLRNQYTAIENRSVGRDKQLVAGDALEKACQTAKPFMEDKYLKSLKDNSQRLDQAVGVTLKLAETTLKNYQQNGGDTAPLKKTGQELKGMLETIVSYQNECEKISKVLSPLMGGAAIVDKSQELGNAINADAMMSNELMKNAADLAKFHKSTLIKCKQLQDAQKQIRARFDQAYDYFSIRSKEDISVLKNDIIGCMIKDYELKKISDSSKSLAADLRYWRKPLQPTEGMKPEIAEIIAQATNIAPEISALQDTLASRIQTIQGMIKKLASPVSTVEPEIFISKPSKPSFNSSKLSEAQLAAMSIKDIREIDKLGEISKAFGFSTISQSTEFKTVETGIIKVKNPNTGIYEKKKYTIGYEKSWDTIDSSGWYGFYQTDRLKKRILDFYLNKTSRKIKFSIPNADECYIGYTNTNLESAAGYAGIGPFLARTTWILVYSIDNRTERVPYDGKFTKDYPWKYIEPNDIKKLKTQIEFWRNKMPEDLKTYLNARLAVPKQLVDFADKHFYKTPAHLLDGLNGFEKAVETKHIQSVSREFNKKWSFAGGYSYSFKMRASAFCSFPETSESWPDLQKRRISVLQKNTSRYKPIKLQNADYALSTLKITLKDKKMKNQVVQFKEIYGDICFLKNNVMVHVGCWGEFPINEEIDPHKVAVRILANFKKSSISQDGGKK